MIEECTLMCCVDLTRCIKRDRILDGQNCQSESLSTLKIPVNVMIGIMKSDAHYFETVFLLPPLL